MAYYDRIAKKWHSVTGARGGTFKRHVLNDLLLSKVPAVAGLTILELGAGNGYFLPLVLRKFSGQVPERIVITDQSRALVELAERSFPVPNAEYQVLDIRGNFPFAEETVNLIVANMVFNEVSHAGLRRALAECWRTLWPGGRMLATVTHPDFVESLARRGQLKPLQGALATMPGANGLRLPVVRRRCEEYSAALDRAGFRYHAEPVYPTAEVLSEKPALRQAGGVPLALVFDCEKPVAPAKPEAGNHS